MIRGSASKLVTKTVAPVASRTYVRAAYELAKKVVPKISETEAAALNAGTIGFDKEIFTGKPSLSYLDNYKADLLPKEQAFLDNEVEELCAMLEDYSINKDQDLPPKVWDFIRSKGFMGMIIGEEWGGLGFTAHGHSQIVQKIATRNGSAAVTVMVPNSLGPGELLKRYGTSEQQKYFLPKLASGEFIPCFGLTGPASGSDAAAMRDRGTVVVENGVIGVRATFKKRYITLAPVASVVGLAVDVKDPQGLLKGLGKEGITIALLEKGHPGLRIGDRHDPVGAAFMNGTVEGEEVFIPMEKMLGGQARVGTGWVMLMDCLAEGRGISLPALSVGAAQFCSGIVGAYARVRKQFKVPIAELEGVQEHLARIAGNAYCMTAAQTLMNAMLNDHEQPSVLSAIMKAEMTSRMRAVINDSMDVMGGAAICRGPNNFLANTYAMVPIAITVEGANTLTRSLIIFGQGLMRSHPHLLDLVKSIQNGNDQAGFNRELTNMITHGVSNTFRSLGKAAFRSRSKSNLEEHYISQLERIAANFAISSDISLTLGGAIKFKEMLSGRYADVFSNLYLGYATVWWYKNNKVAGSDKIFDYTMSRILFDAQEALFGIYDNFPIAGVGGAMKAMTFPLGRDYSAPSDKLVREVSNLITTDSAVRTQLMKCIHIPKDLNERVALLNDTLPKAVKADQALSRCRKEKRQPTGAEQALIDEVEAAREIIIQVDSFARLGAEELQPKEYTRPAFNKL